MVIADRLSCELEVDYMELFDKTNQFFSVRQKEIREDIRLHRTFLPKERDFLACLALEYLKENGIDSPDKLDNVKHYIEESEGDMHE